MPRNRRAGRRNRTFSGRADWQPRGANRRNVFGRLVTPLVLVLAVAGTAAYFAVFSPLIWVHDVDVSGTKTTDGNAIARDAEAAAEYRLGPIASRSLLLVDPGAVEEAVKREHEDAADVAVTKRWPNALEIDVVERQSTLLWQSRNQYYLVDEQGVAFDVADSEEKLITVEDSTGLPVELGQRVSSARFIKSLQDIRRDMETAGFAVTGFRIPESTFEVQAITDQGFYAVFDTTRSASFQVDALKRATDEIKPGQYADLRVPGRVYVR